MYSADATAYRLFSRHYEGIEGTAEEPYLVVDGSRYPIVNRFTRNFDQKIYMIRGNPAAVEHVELNPDSTILQTLYNELKAQIECNDSTSDILGKILKITQFHLANFDETDQFILEMLNQNQNNRIVNHHHLKVVASITLAKQICA